MNAGGDDKRLLQCYARYSAYEMPRIPELAKFMLAPQITRQLESDMQEFTLIRQFVAQRPAWRQRLFIGVTLTEFELLLGELICALDLRRVQYAALTNAIELLRGFGRISEHKQPETAYKILRAFQAVWPGFLTHSTGTLGEQMRAIATSLALGSPVLAARPDIILSENRRFEGQKTYKILICSQSNVRQCNFDRPFSIDPAGSSAANSARVFVCGVQE